MDNMHTEAVDYKELFEKVVEVVVEGLGWRVMEIIDTFDVVSEIEFTEAELRTLRRLEWDLE